MNKIKTCILNIDTSNNQIVVVGLDIGGKNFTLERSMDKNKAQVTLPMIDELLRKHKLGLKDLSEIKVNPGPGSFTGLRVGISIANALGYQLKIPVNGIMGIVEPEYD